MIKRSSSSFKPVVKSSTYKSYIKSLDTNKFFCQLVMSPLQNYQYEMQGAMKTSITKGNVSKKKSVKITKLGKCFFKILR